jgi:tetrahydromethanopterin S-methyltransferase subunit B
MFVTTVADTAAVDTAAVDTAAVADTAAAVVMVAFDRVNEQNSTNDKKATEFLFSLKSHNPPVFSFAHYGIHLGTRKESTLA